MNKHPTDSSPNYHARFAAIRANESHALNQYIVSVRDAGDIDAQMAERVWYIWCTFDNTVDKDIPVPDAAPGPNGEFLYTWNKGDHHLELEILPNGTAEFFYLNRSTNETWEDEYATDSPISQEVRERLAIFQ